MTVRVAIVCDYPEEGWASMDLTGEKMLTHLNRDCAGEVEAVRVCPPFRRRLSRNADRLANRFWDYPRALRAIVRRGEFDRGEFDLYHLADHSYSQLVHVLPPGRAVVTCHDLDTFRCLLDPAREPRPFWFRGLTRRILTGFQQAAAVVCNTEATRRAVLNHNLIAESRLHVVPLGIHPECSPEPDPAADAEAARLLGPDDPAAPPLLLHVGSTISRKRIDLLLQVVAALRRILPGVRLIKAGGALTLDQRRQAHELGLDDALIALPFFRDDERAILAAVYRRAALVLQPSDAEGLGLPVIEALACGAQVLASDLPALREVGEGAAVFRDVGDVPAWTGAALSLLDDHRAQTPAYHSRRAAGLARAAHFQWPHHARQLARLYRSLPP